MKTKARSTYSCTQCAKVIRAENGREHPLLCPVCGCNTLELLNGVIQADKVLPYGLPHNLYIRIDRPDEGDHTDIIVEEKMISRTSKGVRIKIVSPV